MMSQMRYGDTITTYVYDANGNLTYIIEGPNEIAFEYDNNGNLKECVLLTPEHNPLTQMDYDGMGRVISVGVEDQPQEDNYYLYLSYDGLGNLITSRCKYDDVNSITVSLLSWETENPKGMVYEKKLDGGQTKLGLITYYEYDELGRIIKKIKGHSGDTTEYQYDVEDMNRVTTIIEPEGPILYQYDANGRLTGVEHYDNNYDGSFQYTAADIDEDRIITVTSNTVSADPNYNKLGKLELRYDSNDMLMRIGYTTDESDLAALSTICTFRYEYDGLGRITKVTCESPPEPNLVITINPDISEAGSYMVTQYEYDSQGRHIYTVNTCGYLARALYHDMLSQDKAPRAMASVVHDLHAPPKLTVIWNEYDGEGRLLRSSDLDGHMTVLEDYEAVEGGGGQYAITLGGGGQYAIDLGGGGQYYFALGGGGQYSVPLLPLGGGGIGKMLGMFGFDEYGNTDILIDDEEEAEVLLAAKKKKAKKKISLKATKKKSARLGCQEIVEADLTGDCKVNWYDVAVIAGSWLEDQSP